MTVRAKFRCDSIEATKQGDETLKSIKLHPVYADSPENKDFFRWTPSGEIALGILNPAASDQFELGAEYYVDFSPAPKAR